MALQRSYSILIFTGRISGLVQTEHKASLHFTAFDTSLPWSWREVHGSSSNLIPGRARRLLGHVFDFMSRIRAMMFIGTAASHNRHYNR
uniref:Uncharacterized protein n=1 Tax=Tetraselmis sp. GSL018 TaxID=582737 RepID=A0A061SFT1_9CHLO